MAREREREGNKLHLNSKSTGVGKELPRRVSRE